MVCTILSILLYARAPPLGGVNGDVQSEMVTLAFNQGEQIEDCHSTILRLQQEINLYGETVPPKKLLLQYMKALESSDKLKAFIAPNITDLIILLDKNRKLYICTGGNIHGIYCYIFMIGAPNNLNSSSQ